MVKDELVSARMVARLVDMVPSTVQQMIKDGKLDSEDVDGRKRVWLSSISSMTGATMEMLYERLTILKKEIAENMRNRNKKATPKKKVERAGAIGHLTETERNIIRKRYTGKHGEQTALAHEFGVSQSTIWKIVQEN